MREQPCPCCHSNPSCKVVLARGRGLPIVMSHRRYEQDTMNTMALIRLAGGGSRAITYTTLLAPAGLWCVQNESKNQMGSDGVGRLRHAVKLSSLRPISSSGASLFDAAESYGISDRLAVVTVRPHAPVCPRACLSPSALAYESLRMTCTYASPGLTAAPTAARLQVQGVRVHPQQGPHHLGACGLDRGRIGCGLHPCELAPPRSPRSPSSLQWPQCRPYITCLLYTSPSPRDRG